MGCGGSGFLKAGIKKIPCTMCEGGQIMTKCSSCDGKGIHSEKAKELISIPRGVSKGVNLRLPGKGNYSLQEKARPGDLLLKLEVAEHDSFKRQGKNIYTEVALTVPEAVLGAEKSVKTVKGEVKSVRIEPRSR